MGERPGYLVREEEKFLDHGNMKKESLSEARNMTNNDLAILSCK